MAGTRGSYAQSGRRRLRSHRLAVLVWAIVAVPVLAHIGRVALG